MATFYPNSSAQLDAVSTPYIQDQKFTSNYDSPMIHGNLMMYLNEASSAGSFSEIGPATSMSNCVEIPSMVLGRNEMMHPVEGEQNLQGLSLSLSTQLSTAVQPPSFQHFSNHLPDKVDEAFEYKDLTNPAYGQYDFHGDGQSFIRFGAQNNLQYMVNPKGVGYNGYQYEQASSASSIMKSKYLKATQQLLDEIVNVQDALKQHESAKQQNVSKFEDKLSESNEKSAADSDVNELLSSAPSKELSATERQELQNKLDKLLTMLDEADRRYKQYYHQMQVLVSSFDLAAGSGGAKPYTTLARKTISRHFRSLRDAIGVQIQNTRRSLGEQDSGQGVIPRLRHVDLQLRQQRALQQFGMMRHAWRPQRGLPENAVTTLRAWLFEHFLHPYPKDSEKIMLARQTGLTRGQVANWFINARVRLWKPMIEEIYKEEFGDADLNLKSSSENNTPKAAGEKSWASEDRSIADAMPSHDDYKTTVYHHTTEMSQSTGRDGVMVGPHGGDDKHRGVIKLSEDHHQGLTNHGFYPHDQNSLISFQVQELGNYGVDNQVTLALGLRRVDGDVGHVSDETGLRPGSSAVDDAIEPGTTTTEYSYFGGVNQQHRFSNSHLLNDFVV